MVMSDPKRILIVDDNRSLVRVTEGVLHRQGFEIITAYDGPEGLQRAQAEKPDLIILDIVMPSMSGYEVCRRLPGYCHAQQAGLRGLPPAAGKPGALRHPRPDAPRQGAGG